MNGLWQMWESCVPPDICDQIVQEGKSRPKMSGTITSNSIVDTNIRSSNICWIRFGDEVFEDIWKFVERKFHEANVNAFGVDINYIESLQFTNYDASIEGHYGWHEDIFWEKNSPSARKLSMVIQLTDPNNYTGGNLELQVPQPPDLNTLRKKGTLIVFPSFVKHRVTKVESGERNSLVAWIEGPNWR
jgi:PKHD-type hydroxylase